MPVQDPVAESPAQLASPLLHTSVAMLNTLGICSISRWQPCGASRKSWHTAAASMWSIEKWALRYLAACIGNLHLHILHDVIPMLGTPAMNEGTKQQALQQKPVPLMWCASDLASWRRQHPAPAVT